MKTMLLAVLAAVLFLPTNAAAQATGSSKITFDQAAPDLATAQGYTFKHYDDSLTVGVALTGVTCAAKVPPVTGTFACVGSFPAETPGSHSLTLTSANVAGESLPSVPFAFVFVVIPTPPTNIKIGH
jgi:hypothetical protein